MKENGNDEICKEVKEKKKRGRKPKVKDASSEKTP